MGLPADPSRQVVLWPPSPRILVLQWAGVGASILLLASDAILIALGWVSPSISTFRLAGLLSAASLATTVAILLLGRRYPAHAFVLSMESFRIRGIPSRSRVEWSSVESVQRQGSKGPVLRLRPSRGPIEEVFATFLLSPAQADEIEKWIHGARAGR